MPFSTLLPLDHLAVLRMAATVEGISVTPSTSEHVLALANELADIGVLERVSHRGVPMFRVSSVGVGEMANFVNVTLPIGRRGNSGNLLDLFCFASPGQSNGNGISPRAQTPLAYYNTNNRARSFDFTSNTLGTFSLGSVVGTDVVGANDHAITKAIVPSYDNGVGPNTGFVKRWLENNATNNKQLLIFTKDLTPPVNTNSSTTMFWLSTLVNGWKTEMTALINLLKAEGCPGISPYFFDDLGEGNGDTSPATAVYLAEMTQLVDQMVAHVVSQATANFLVAPVRVGVVIKQQPRYATTIVPLQRQFAVAYPNARVLELPGFNPATGFIDGTHYTTLEILRLGEYIADVVHAGWVASVVVPPTGPLPGFVTSTDAFASFGTHPDVVKSAGGRYSTTATTGGWEHTLMGTAPLAAGQAGIIHMPSLPSDALVIIGLHDSPTPYASFNAKAGLYFEPKGNNLMGLRGLSGVEVNPTFFVDPLVTNTRYGVQRTSTGAINLVRNSGSGWVVISPLTLPNAGAITYAGDMWACLSLLNNGADPNEPTPSAVDVRQSW